MLMVTAVATIGFAQYRGDDHMTGWQWVMMIVFATLFAALLATAIWALFVHTTRTGRSSDQPTPEDLLAERYARGEINTDEYKERLAALRQ